MFGGIDFIIIALILCGILAGIVRGFLGTFIDLFGIALSLALASFLYRGPVRLMARFGITGSVVELVLFLFTVVVLILTIIISLEALRKKTELRIFVDRFFGGVLGVVEGFVFASGILIITSASFNAATEVQQSKLGPSVARFIPRVYETAERHRLTMPKMIMLPKNYPDEFNVARQGVKFQKLNFAQLEGSICMKCRGTVLFEGYFIKEGAGMVPRFRCVQCGRLSDGCQTFQGFHTIYGTCPVDLAKKEQKFDCGNWFNYEWITPKGACPVDGNEIKSWLWTPPVTYKRSD